MSYETILFEVDSDIARLTLNRPDKLNSFNTQMHREVRQLCRACPQAAPGSWCYRAPGRGFCCRSGLGRSRGRPRLGRRRLGESLENRYNPLVLTLHNLPMPVIAAVNGVAAGAGANIALACDIVVAARSRVSCKRSPSLD